MADASRDQNNIPCRLAVLNTDTEQGQNFVNLSINSDGTLRVNQADTISFTMQPVDPKDENYVNCWLFEGPDGLLYPAVANASGELLIDRA